MADPLTSRAWVAAWLQKATHDLEIAQRALHAGHPITDAAAHHCHQAAENALRAFLASHARPLLKSHDPMDLLTQCASADSRFGAWADQVAELAAFGTATRYPSIDADPT